MPAINQTFPTLLDLVKRVNPDGTETAIVEMLTQRNPLLAEMVWKEGNLPTGHRFGARTALPSIAWRRMNEGVAFTKSKVDQIDETCGQMTALAAVDKQLVKLHGAGGAAFRMSEQRAFLQSFNNTFESAAFYSSIAATPEQIQGLAPRLGSTTGFWGSQILKHDGSASGNDQTSIWLACWGPDTMYGIYPKGSTGGLESTDMGEQLVDDGSGKKFVGYVNEWSWRCGICVQDSRYLVRIANVDTGNLLATGKALIQSMVRATHMVQDLKSGRPVFYVDRSVATFLHLQALDSTTQSTLRVEKIGAEPITTLLGIPIRETDGLLNTEAPIT